MVKEKETEQLTAESVLGPQFGTDPVILVKGKYDNKIYSKIHPFEPACMAYFLRKQDKRGGRFWKGLIGDMLKLKRSEEGWGTNKTIQFTAATKGAPSVGELQRKPNIFQRNVTDRDWKEKAQEQGRTIVE